MGTENEEQTWDERYDQLCLEYDTKLYHKRRQTLFIVGLALFGGAIILELIDHDNTIAIIATVVGVLCMMVIPEIIKKPKKKE